MYYNGQTLRHKRTNRLVKLATKGDTAFAWDIGKKTALYDEEGKPFADDIANYACVYNELGQPESGASVKDRPDLSLKKYIGVDLKKMRKATLARWEAEVLAKMDKDGYVHCAFANGSHCPLFEKYFLSRRGAKPLYEWYDNFRCNVSSDPKKPKWTKPKWYKGPLSFAYKGRRWLVEENVLTIIRKPKQRSRAKSYGFGAE